MMRKKSTRRARNQNKLTKRTRIDTRRKFQSEPLEARCLLAGDLVAHWNADTFASDAESWVDSVGGVAAGVFGQPSLAAGEINGRSVVSLDAADGVDGFRIAVSDSPMSNAADYSLVVVFRTDATSFNGDANSNWYEATGLVDGNALGFSQDWGMTINGDGRIMTGLGGGFLSPSTTLVGANSLNDGQLQVAVVTKQGAELSIYENGQLTGSATHINSDARYSSSITIGMVNGTNTNGFTGQIGQVLIYDGALDASEVQSLQSEWEAYYDNAQPVAMGDTYTLTEDQGLFFQTALNGVLANDSDADGDTLTAVLVTPPEHGTFSLNADGGFIYGVDRDFFGTDSFTYTANDFRASEPVTVTFNVTPQYDAPTAVADHYDLMAGQTSTISAEQGVLGNDLNPDASPLTIEVTQAVSAGSLTMNQDGSFQYDPQGFSGPATFAYRISDGQTPSSPVTVSLRVNSAPTAVNDSYSVNEDASLTVTAATGILQNDTDAEGDTLTLTVISETAHGEVDVQPTGEFTYTPAGDFSGEDQFTYVVNDGLADSAVGVVRIQVVGVNDAPVGRSDVIILPGGGTQQIAASDGVLANDSDIDGPALTAVLETAPQTGSIELAADGSFRYTPGPTFNRLDQFAYRVTDGTATSEPISVTLVQAADPGNTTPKGDSIVTFNEVMYNPVGDADSQLEWIELHNQMAINMDISRWSLGGGIDFFFPEGTVIPGGGFLVVAANPEEFTAATGQTNVMGPYSGRLANDGEELLLINNSQRIMDRMVYVDSGDWPVAADGSGATLTKKFRHLASGEADSWTFSSNVGGSPGVANPAENDALPALVFNEIAAASDETFRLELANLSSESVSLAGWGITTDDSLTPVYALGDGTLSAGDYLVITESQLGFKPADQQRLFLVHADGTVADARQVTGRLRGRAAELDYAWEYPATETFGAANQFQFQSDIVINEIMYQAAGFYVSEIDKYFDSPEEWVELYNKGDAAVDLSAWAFSEGIRYEFAAGTTLGAGQYLVLAKDPASLIGRYDHLTTANTFGPYDGQLADGGERLRLDDAVGNPADVVTYYDGGRWHDTADGYGSSLELKDPGSDNTVAESWASSDETSKTAWQTITYSGSGRNNLNDPQQYHEFLLGMLDAGEVLIDDVTVKVNPGQADEVQLIQNGSFEADALGSSPATWRIIGTQHGTVVADPDNPENQVLRLVATGPTEHMHNNAGTTLKDGDTYHRISNSSDYEISFKARWVSGSAQLNSRLYFNRLPMTIRLDRPENGGTPGLVNSTFVSNAGPTYDGFIHSPIIPDVNQAMTVSVDAFDPQGVQGMTLYYSVNGGEFASVPMTLVGQKYEGTIPGQAEGAAVQFYVEGTDTAGGMSQFPAAGPDSRALIRVNDGQSDDSPLHELRIVMTPDDTAFLHETTNVMSNDRLGATVIYNDQEVFYDVGVRLKGSQRGRDKVVRAGFNLQFDPMQLFRDVHSTIGIDRSGSGDEYSQEEIITRQIVNHAGNLPQIYDDLVYVIAPQSRHTGTAMLNMARYNDIFLDSYFENGSQGTAFEYELIYFPTSTVGGVEGLKRPNPDSVVGVNLTDLGDDKEMYRWHWLIENNRQADDYSLLMEALGAIGGRTSDPNFDAELERLFDIDQWLRALAVQIIMGIGDNYSSGAQHNGIFYASPEGKLLHLPWDLDFSFTQGTSTPLMGNADLRKLTNQPVHEHNYYGHVYDILQTTLNSEYMDPWVDHFDELVPRQRFASFKNWISGRARNVITQIERAVPVVPFEITTASPLNVGEQRTATIQGTGWVDVRSIRLTGESSNLDLQWLTDNQWSLAVPVDTGTTEVSLTAYDFQGQPVDTKVITVTSTGAAPVRDFLRISEVHYNPADPAGAEPALDNDEFEFIELVNIGSEVIDLTGAQFDDGIEFTFGAETLSPGEYIVVPKNIDAFVARYGYQIRITSTVFGGQLSNGGESLRLVDANGTVVQEFEYRDDWYPTTDGEGASLEVTKVNAAELSLWNTANHWSASAVPGGTPGSESRLPGDSNADGVFDLADLLLAFQAGEFEDAIPGNSTWEEGDWNGDGDFTTQDLVFVFQAGSYTGQAIPPAAAVPVTRQEEVLIEQAATRTQRDLTLVAAIELDERSRNEKREQRVKAIDRLFEDELFLP